MKNKIRIGLLYHSFISLNLGLGALAVSECAIIKSICERLNIEYEMISFELSNSEKGYADLVENVVLDKFSYKISTIKKFKKCDLLIDATGGDSMTDIYGIKNFTAIFIEKFYTVFSGRPVVLAPQTIGPFKKRLTRAIANIYMNHVNHIFLRDELSKTEISRRTLKKVTVASDMAFKLPYKTENKEKDGRLKVGFNISGLLFTGSYKLKKHNGFNYQQLCYKIIDLLKANNFEIIIIPHVIGDYDDSYDNDTKVSIDIAKEKNVKVAPLFKNPVEAKNYISNLDFFIGSRMHATIAAVSTGVPTVPIAYSRKFKGVFEPLEYNAVLDANTLSENEILKKLDYYINHIEELSILTLNAKKNAYIKLDMYESYLKNLITDILRNMNFN